ncbi:unnamed protein product [Caenorhabditis brenneri]
MKFLIRHLETTDRDSLETIALVIDENNGPLKSLRTWLDIGSIIRRGHPIALQADTLISYQRFPLDWITKALQLPNKHIQIEYESYRDNNPDLEEFFERIIQHWKDIRCEVGTSFSIIFYSMKVKWLKDCICRIFENVMKIHKKKMLKIPLIDNKRVHVTFGTKKFDRNTPCLTQPPGVVYQVMKMEVFSL